VKAANSLLVDLPTPPNISAIWNFGSLLGLCLVLQIITGLFLAFHYQNSIDHSFSRVVHICRDVSFGWSLRRLHGNGASFFFICIYLHIGRGLYYNSFRNLKTWLSGIIILFLLMATAFLGYVLPWGQISFWGATVITNLLSTVPYLGQDLVQWLWGGFSVDSPTLTRFFAFHFILPFLILAITGIHIIFLHETGSNNPMGLASSQDKIPFHPYFSIKDTVGFSVLLIALTILILVDPNLLGDPENFNIASPINTPPHIQPEWYYLFAYAILRAIPNKFGGVIALVLSIAILIIVPITQAPSIQSHAFYPINQGIFWSFVVSALLLTWVGARPVEDPYILVGQILTVLYFSFFLVRPAISSLWDKALDN